MGVDRRLITLVLAVALLAVPALILRVACVGRACEDESKVRAGDVPFCSLPGRVRSDIAAGFREGRSPEVLAAAASPVVGGTGYGPRRGPAWPAADADTRVPLFFWGSELELGPIPAGTTLDAVAPTIAELIDLDRPHPEVRSGEAIPSISALEPPRLVVLLVASGLGSADFPSDGLFPTGSAGTLEARTGSQPLDPASVLATIGTGGMPSQHGITGRWIRNDDARLVEAWSDDAPVSVIAALADDLDEATSQKALIGAALSERSDRGIVGGNWYVDNDRDDLMPSDGKGEQSLDLGVLERRGYGRDDVTDLFAVVVKGGLGAVGDAIEQVTAAAAELSRDSYAIAFTATGARGADGQGAPALAKEVERQIGAPVIEGVAAGGFFLDAAVQTEEKIPEDRVIEAMRALRNADGEPVFADVFPSLAVSFARYC